MIKHRDSHVDHGLTEAQLRYLLDRFADRDSFFIETLTFPREFGTVPCGLYGPTMGDPPIGEDEVTYARRGDRAWDSRLIDLPPRQQYEVTVIAGPHEETCPDCQGTGERLSLSLTVEFMRGDQYVPCERCGGAWGRPNHAGVIGGNGTGKIKHACILYTAFGGPLAPQEPGDTGCKDPEASAAFWREHALAR